MSAFPSRSGLALWTGALALALAFLAVDSALRLRTIGLVSTLRVSDAPVPARDDASATGYELDQHRLILPVAGTDGYHWILQTERMLAGDGLRIRHTLVDNAPHGRDVHWSSPPRWWLAGLALAHRAGRPGLSRPQALEQVAPTANTLLFAILLLGLTPLLAWRLGATAAALFALGWIAVFPLYESFMAGILDHHGVLAMSCFVSLALLVGGGGGWVRDGPIATAGKGTAGDGLRRWLPEPRGARRWFIAAGVTAGLGMWISAVTLLPVIIATGVAAVVAAALPRPDVARATAWRPAPGLWRVWGAAGCATSLAAWLIEYFPSHMAMRLEVNHPLYALAWLAGGDLVARVGRWLADRGAPQPADRAGRERAWAFVVRERRWLLPDLLLIAAVPAIVLATGDATFRLADPFLRALHHEHILEFRGLASHLAAVPALHIVQSTSLLPLILLPLAALVARAEPTDPRTTVRRGLAGAMVLGGIAFVHVASFSSVHALLAAAGLLPHDPASAPMAVHLLTLVPDAAAFALLYRWPARAPGHGLRPPELALLVLPAVPALALLALSFVQVRWLGTAAAALLALLVAAAALHSIAPPTGRPQPRQRVAAAVLLALVLVPFPLFTALFPWRFGYPGAADAPQVIARDVAHTLRARSGTGTGTGVIVSGPTMTTWLVYFGGFRGLGTLYWENLAGLEATAAIFAAPSADEARALIDRHGVTHLVIPPGDPLVTGSTLFADGDTPAWLVPVDYALPPVTALDHTTLRVYEVGREPSR